MKHRRVHKAILGTTAIALFVSLLAGSPAAWSATKSDGPMRIDFANNVVTDASGNALRVVGESGDEAESTTYAETQSGGAVVIVRQSALPDSSPDRASDAIEASPSPDVIEKAAEFPGTLPAELVGTDFIEGDVPQSEEGSLQSEAVDPSLFTLRFVQAVTPTTVSFAWSAREGVASSRITRDGKVVAEGNISQFAEADLKSGSKYIYEVTSLDAEGGTVGTRTMPLTIPSTKTTAKKLSVSPLTYQPFVSGMVYRTFIPDSSVSMDFMTTMGCGQAGQTGMTFSGDGRSWKTPPSNAPWDTTTYRTSVFINVNWGNAAPYDVVWVNDVHPTKLFKNGVLKETRTAPVAGIKITNASSTANFAQAHINHAVGNPFCAAGAITYNAWARFYRSGTFEVSGSRFPVPNHEVYGGWDDGKGNKVWRPLARLTNSGFTCLTGACGSTQVYGSANF